MLIFEDFAICVQYYRLKLLFLQWKKSYLRGHIKPQSVDISCSYCLGQCCISDAPFTAASHGRDPTTCYDEVVLCLFLPHFFHFHWCSLMYELGKGVNRVLDPVLLALCAGNVWRGVCYLSAL